MAIENGTGPGAHQHLLVTARTPRCVLQKLTPDVLKQFLLDVVDRIGMTVLIPPSVAYSREGNNTGYTGFVGITTSHVAFHHWDIPDPGVLHFEVFSCRSFEPRGVIEFLTDFWECNLDTASLLTRYPVRSMQDVSPAAG